MENFDATVLTPATPRMAADFSVHPIDLGAGVSASVLTLGTQILLSG